MKLTSLVFLENYKKNNFGCRGYIPGHECIPTEMDFFTPQKIQNIQNELKKIPLSISYCFPFWNIWFVFKEISETEIGIFFIRK